MSGIGIRTGAGGPTLRQAIVGTGLLLALALIAFWPSYLGKPFAAIDAYTHAHAALGSAWLLLLIGQPLALKSQRRAWHRAVGRYGWTLAALFVVSGVLLAHYRFSRMDAPTFQAEAHWMFLPFYACTAFAACVGMGFAFRRLPAAHGRFMLCSGALLIDPVMARLLGHYAPPLPWPPLYQLIGFGLTDAVLIAVLFSARMPASARRAAVALMVLVLALNLGWFALAPTPAWLAAAGWFRNLPLT